jgi:hypothetical protein
MNAIAILRFLHLVGVIALGAGLVGAFVTELRIRRTERLDTLREALYYQVIFAVCLVFPGAIVVGLSGVLMVLELGLGFFDAPWLTGMWLLFAFEFVEGNTLTRAHGVRVRRELEHALHAGVITPGFRGSLQSRLGTFGLCLDLPLGLAMISLGTMRPSSWNHFAVATTLAFVSALVLTTLVLRIEPQPSKRSEPHESLEEASA